MKKELSINYSNSGYLSDRDELTINRFNNNQISTTITWPFKIGNIVLSYNNNRDENNWSYINAAKFDEYIYINHDNIPREQENAYNYNDNYYTMFNGNLKNIKYGFVLNYSLAKYGISGWYDQPFENAYINKKDLSCKLFYDHILSEFSSIKLLYIEDTGSKHVFINEVNPFYYTDNNDKYSNQSVKVTSTYGNSTINALIGLEYKKEEINSEMITDSFKYRENYSAYSKLDLVEKISDKYNKIYLYGGIREEYFTDTKDFQTLYSLGSHTEISNGNFSIIPKISYHRNYRLPTFSSMFWADNLYSSGNPDLKPEFSSMYDASLSMSFGNSVFSSSIYLTCYYKELENLIIWTRKTNGKYIPENLEGGEITGTESGFDIGIKKSLKISIGLNTLSSKQFTDNNVTNGKEIIYKPDVMINSKLDYIYKDFNLGYSSKYNGHMFLNKANSLDIDPFWLHGIFISYDTQFTANLKIKYYVNIDNILDEQYQIIYGYPMPGRKIESGIKLELK